MFSVMAIIFGSTSTTLIFVWPVYMALLLVAAGFLEPLPGTKSTRLESTLVASLCVVYVVLWAFIGQAAFEISDPDRKVQVTTSFRVAAAPRGPIIGFYFLMFFIFSSFAGFYIASMFGRLADPVVRDAW